MSHPVSVQRRWQAEAIPADRREVGGYPCVPRERARPGEVALVGIDGFRPNPCAAIHARITALSVA